MKQSIDQESLPELLGAPTETMEIDPRCVPPTSAQVARWMAWSAPAYDTDSGTLSDERGD